MKIAVAQETALTKSMSRDAGWSCLVSDSSLQPGTASLIQDPAFFIFNDSITEGKGGGSNHDKDDSAIIGNLRGHEADKGIA